MPRTLFIAAALCWCALTPRAAVAHEALATTLDRLEEVLRQDPGKDSARAARAWLMLDHGLTGAPVAEDIDSLGRRPAWRSDALRLRAWHLFLQERYREASAQARRNLKAGIIGPEQYRLLAGSALAGKDTAGALRAYRAGWEKLRFEEDYLSMVRLSQGGGDVSETLLQEGLRAYPESPGVYAAIFHAYLRNGSPASLRKALALSGRAQEQLWPRSVDWKIWHARALIASGKRARAEEMLLRAMDFLEGETRLRPDSDLAMRLRQEIFELLDSVQAKKK